MLMPRLAISSFKSPSVPAHTQKDHRVIEMTTLEHESFSGVWRLPCCGACHRRVFNTTGLAAFGAGANYGALVAASAIAASIVAIALTFASYSLLSSCRFPSQTGSLYESHVLPDPSCQTSAFSGRSIPIV